MHNDPAHFPDARLSSYLEYDEHCKAFFPKLPHAMTIDGSFIERIELDRDQQRVWIGKSGRKSHVMPIQTLAQVSVWSVELVA